MNKKMIAPVVIGIIVGCYFLMWIAMICFLRVNWVVLIVIGIPLTALLFLWIHVVKERLDEIRSGEEDDLGKY